MERSAVDGAPESLHGFPAALTSFVGRAQVVDKVAAQLGQYRLVTVTGPGGAGKTRLAGEVARQVGDRFADGVWLAELAPVTDPAQVAAVVGTALGIRDLPSVAAADDLARALARRQLLLVLDNCEHVIGAAAELCGRLLLGADDVRVLATSREPLRIGGEVRYRLGPLTLPDLGDLAAAMNSEAVTLFADRARRVVGDLTNLCGVLWHRTILDLRTGRIDDAPTHLRELFQIATQTGLRPLLPPGLDCCGHLCAATGRPAEALTVWAAMSALGSPWPMHGGLNPDRREELRRQARELVGPAQARAAEERGAAMTLATTTEYAVLLACEPVRPPGNGRPADGDGAAEARDGVARSGECISEAGLKADGEPLARLSPRERELVALVARGHTDAQIAGQLYITMRTVSSHLDRIRDKTGCRRRADLTRLALGAGLV